MSTKPWAYRSSRGLLGMLLIEQWSRCFYCDRFIQIKSKSVHAGDRATIDHRVPLYKGGDPYGENVVACCQLCNGQKGPLSEAEFLIVRGDVGALKAAVKRASLEAQAAGSDPSYTTTSKIAAASND